MNAPVAHAPKENASLVWTSPIKSELELVETRLRTAVESDVSTALDISMHLFASGGKRIRPALTILSALASGTVRDKCSLIDIATAAELFHTASLIHDDVVDETSERRGRATAASQWGNKISVLGGDFLLARTFFLLAGVGNVEVFDILSRTAARMTECEILQACSEGDVDSWMANYWQIIEGKTAAFLSGCCECGAVLSNADRGIRDALSRYGFHVGIAFQITDDVLDIAGDPAQTGKDYAADLAQGKFTLPVILALSRAEQFKKESLQNQLRKGYLCADEARKVAELVIETGAIQAAQDEAQHHTRLATQQLSLLPPSEYRSALESFADLVTDRRH